MSLKYEPSLELLHITALRVVVTLSVLLEQSGTSLGLRVQGLDLHGLDDEGELATPPRP